MNSDIKSMQDQGGNAPKPYTPPTPPPPVGGPVGSVPPKIPSGDSPFQPPQVPPTEPPVPPAGGISQPPQNIAGGDMPEKKSNKKLFITLLVALIVIAVAVAAYFFVIPLFGNDEDVTDTTTPPETEQFVPDDTIDIPTVPEADVPNGDTFVQDEDPEDAVAGGVPAEFHVSLFSPQADTTVFLEPNSLILADIKSVFSLSPTDVPLFREIVFRNSDGTMILFEELAPVLLPSVFTETLASLFESDATYFTYTDSDNTWFGFAARLKADADKSIATAAASEIENVKSEVAGLYLNDPGTPGDWNDGQTNGETTRYIPFSLTGASMGITWLNDILLISTNYEGAKEAASRL
ncbi:MAG TPA: hypothetical protein ENH86_00020 [Candidatus Jorgensenbacteria bacterium]|uniref:Uncharacterized protein n=1 Tax=marine sediment metagenome TaxID=412755 RepID=A0A0F9IUA7_9ZZZZ|nr:hypothetical protein [Candidatus Jorgensenbacteria bacterium]